MGPEVVIEDPAILPLNIKRYQHQPEAESDPAKRQQIMPLFQEAKDAQGGPAASTQRLFRAGVWGGRQSQGPRPRGVRDTRGKQHHNKD